MSIGRYKVSRRALLHTVAWATILPVAGPAGRALSQQGGQISLMLLGPSPELLGYLNDTALPAFTEETGIAVELQQSDWGSGFQRVQTAAASGTLPDLIMLGGIWTAPLAAHGALRPIDDYLASWDDADALYPAMIADGSYDGVNYALPLYTDTRSQLYRADILEAVGVSVDDLPNTWDEYRAFAETVAASGGPAAQTPIYWNTDRSIGLQQSFAQLMLQAGGTYYDAEGRAVFASEAGVRALEYMVSFFRDGLSDINQVFTGAGPNPLVAGEVASAFGAGFGSITNARQNAPDIVPLIVSGPPLAADAGGEPITSAWINKIAMSANSANPDAAWALMQYLVSREVAENLSQLFGGLPARSDLVDAAYLDGISPGFTAASAHIVPQPAHPNMLIIANEINTAVERALRQQAGPEEVLSDLDATINQINGF